MAQQAALPDPHETKSHKSYDSPPPAPTDKMRHVQRVVDAVGALTSARTERERTSAASFLRECSSRDVRELVVLTEAGAIKPLVALLACARGDIYGDAAVALINLSLYSPSRERIVDAGVLDALGVTGKCASRLGVDASEEEHELALALLQNLSTLPTAHRQVANLFCDALSRFLDAQQSSVYLRKKACAILQHISANADLACVLVKAGLATLLGRVHALA